MSRSWSLLLSGALAAVVAAAQPLRVTNAASFLADDEVSPGSIVSILGQNLAAETAAAADAASPPTKLGGVKVTVAGVFAELYYVSPRQVNARIPPALPPGTAELAVESPLGRQTKTIKLEAADPGVFSTRGSGSRDGAVLDAVTFEPSPFRVTRDGQPVYLAIYATGLTPGPAPTVTIGGVSVPVEWFGAAPCCLGLQQINVRLLPQLAGAGRVPVAISTGGKTSNVVEIVLLPEATANAPQPAAGVAYRAREIAGLAWIPGTTQFLLADENDDVVRLLDAQARQVVAVIALPDGAEPAGIAVWRGGAQPATLAVVSLRDMGKAAVIDVAQRKVVREVTTGAGPAGAAITGDRAVIANQESDTVTIFDITGATPGVSTAPVGRSPYSVEAGPAPLALAANQAGGSVSVVNAAAAQTANTVGLGAGVRPHTVRVLPGSVPWAVATNPAASAASDRALLFNYATGAVMKLENFNPAAGGLSDVAVLGNRAFFANQTNGSVAAATFQTGPNAPVVQSVSEVKTGLGARALAVDPAGRWLAVSNQGSGTVTIIDLSTMTIAGHILAVRMNDEKEGDEQGRGDRDRASNAPSITALSPGQANAGQKIALTITGKNLAGAKEVEFSFPGKGLPPQSHGRGRGPTGKEDKNITVSNIRVNAEGTSLQADIALAEAAEKGDRVVRVKTPNGESSSEMSNANRFTVR